MANFNLLPPELTPKASYIKLSATLKKIAIVSYSVFLILTLTIFAIFYMVSQKVAENSKKESELLTSIEALKETEQRLILTQDRLTIASDILSLPNSSTQIAEVKGFVNELPANVVFISGNILTDGINVNLALASSDDLTNLLSMMYSSGKFKQITMTSFSYSSGGSYGLGLALKN
jgi:hypothetical protein